MNIESLKSYFRNDINILKAIRSEIGDNKKEKSKTIQIYCAGFLAAIRVICKELPGDNPAKTKLIEDACLMTEVLFQEAPLNEQDIPFLATLDDWFAGPERN